MNRLAELAEYDRSIPGLIDDDFLAAGFTPDEVAKYRGTTQPSSRIPRTASRLTPEDISQAEQTYGTLQAPDYTMRETSTQRVQDALINQVGLDPYLAGRYARDIMGDTSPTSQNILDGLGLADLTPLGAVFGVEEGAGTAVEGYQEGDYLKMVLGAAEAGLGVAEAFPLTRPIAEGAGVLAREVYSSPYMADAIGTLRGIRDLDADFLLGRGDPAITQGVGADVVGGQSFDVTRKDASGIFGQGTERVRYTDPASGGTMEVVVRPDGSASVLELEVPEEFRGQGIGQSLQDKVMQDFPMMGGQVSSKAAATTAYRLGRRPAGKPNATLEDVFAEIDEMSSVNMISPQMQSRFGGASAPDIAEGSSGIKLFQGSPHNFAAERLVRYQDGTTEYIVGAPDVLPDVPAGAEVVEDFPLGRMRSDKIGTGEGAQAYGYGLYGAENEGIARSYRDALSKDIPLPADDYNANIYDLVVRRNMGEDAAMKLFQDMKENSPEASENFMQMVQGNIDALESGSWKQYQPPGSMYEVNVNASPEEFLDWDTPFRELPQWQQESIERILKETEKPATPQQIEEIQGFLDELDLPSDYGATYDPMEKIHGGGALGSIERNMQRFQGNPAELTSQRLLEEGFKGVRYLDAGSRGMGFEVKLSHRGKPYETEPIRARSRKEANAISKEYQDKGFDTNIEQAGSRNYVIFDDKLVSIVKKYGIAGAAAFLGANTIDVEQALADNMTQADFEDLVAGPE